MMIRIWLTVEVFHHRPQELRVHQLHSIRHLLVPMAQVGSSPTPTPLQPSLNSTKPTRPREKMNRLCSRTLKRDRWLLTHSSSRVTIRNPITLKTQSSYIRCFVSTISFYVQFSRPMASLQLRAMSGTFYGAAQVARVICMRASTSTRRSTISLKVTRSQGKIGCAITWSGCRSASASRTLISCRTPISFQMNLATSTHITRNLSNMTPRRTFG